VLAPLPRGRGDPSQGAIRSRLPELSGSRVGTTLDPSDSRPPSLLQCSLNLARVGRPVWETTERKRIEIALEEASPVPRRHARGSTGSPRAERLPLTLSLSKGERHAEQHAWGAALGSPGKQIAPAY